MKGTDHSWRSKSNQPWSLSVKSDACGLCGRTPDVHPPDPPLAERPLRAAIIRAVAGLDRTANPDTTPGGWWDRRVEPVIAAIREATPADSLDAPTLAKAMANVDPLNAGILRGQTDPAYYETRAREIAAEYDRLLGRFR